MRADDPQPSRVAGDGVAGDWSSWTRGSSDRSRVRPVPEPDLHRQAARLAHPCGAARGRRSRHRIVLACPQGAGVAIDHLSRDDDGDGDAGMERNLFRAVRMQQRSVRPRVSGCHHRVPVEEASGACSRRRGPVCRLRHNEPFFRTAAFILMLSAMMIWELVAKRRPQMLPRSKRWPGNLLLVVIDTAIVRLVFPVAAVGAAVYAQDLRWGVFNVLILPGWVVLILSVLVLDAAIYFQHRIFHRLPWLWRIHRVHHADQEFDVATALRFHPLEMLLSMAIKIAVVMMLGAPPIAVIVFEILLNATAMFNHGNVQLSAKADQYLRLFLVTPDMHRVHHSVIPQETNSNFGFNLPWWDRLFGTYRSQPERGHLGMTIGLDDYRTEQDQQLGRMLVQPFQRTATRPSTPE